MKKKSQPEKMAKRRRHKLWKKTFQLLVIISLLAGLSSLVLAQRQSGSIKGKIINQEGDPIPGILIYVYSPNLLGMRTYITSDRGEMGFPGLSPGTYKITIEMPGFKTVNIENIIVRVGKTVTLNITMEPTTLEEEITKDVPSPTLDIESTKTAVNIEKELLENIPLAKNLHDIVNLAAGVVPEFVPYQKTSFIHGSTGRANTYTIDGMIMNDPSGRHLLTNINYDTLEEVELETAAHPADVRFTDGGYINVITKSGGNKSRGEINLYHTNKSISSNLRSTEETSGAGISRPTMDKYMWDFSLSLGGSFLEDRLWYFGNIRTTSQSRTTPFIPWTDPLGNSHNAFDRSNKETMGFFKLSSQFIPGLKVTAMFNFASCFRSVYESGLSWNIPEEATYTLDHGRNFTGFGTLTYIMNQNTFVDVKAGYTYHKLPLRLSEKWSNNPQFFNEGTGHLWGSNGLNETQLKNRFQAGVYLTRLQNNLLGGDHQLQVGAEYEYAMEERAAWKTDNLLIDYYYGNPYYFGLDQSPVTSNTVGKGKISFYTAGKIDVSENNPPPKIDLRRFSLFAQDSITFVDRLTLFLGLRFDRSETKFYAHLKEQSGNPVSLKIGEELIAPLYDVNPYGLFANESIILEWEDMLVWNSLSPRFGLSLDIFGNGRSVFKASLSRYSEPLMLNYLFNLDPVNAHRSHQFYWFDENMDGKVDVDDNYTLYPEDYRMYTREYYTQRIAPGTKSPHTDEYTLGLHQELLRDFFFRVSYIHKTKRNILENVLYSPDQDKDWYTADLDTENWWIPFETIVPAVDDYPDTQVTAYYWSNSAPALFNRIKNVPELKRKYQALEIVFKKHMSHNWQLNGSIVFSKTTGNIDLGHEANSGFSIAADSPNYFENRPINSRLDFDRPLVIKLLGTYRFPYDFYLSFYYTYMSGTPRVRSIKIIPPSSWVLANSAYSTPAEVYLERPGERRTEAYSNLDLRIEKGFRVGKSGRLSVHADILNVLGYKYDFTIQNDGGFWFPDAEGSTQGTRVLSSNYNNITSLFGVRTLRLSLSLNF